MTVPMVFDQIKQDVKMANPFYYFPGHNPSLDSITECSNSFFLILLYFFSELIKSLKHARVDENAYFI